jgi:anthranilate/para-aminobenzoate synthase component I
VRDLEVPDGWVGFYDDSVLVWDHLLDKGWVISTGLLPDGSRSRARAVAQADAWERRRERVEATGPLRDAPGTVGPVCSSLSREAFLRRVEQARAYIRQGHIYQVNLSQRLSVASEVSGWELFQRLNVVSPAPYAAYLNTGGWN